MQVVHANLPISRSQLIRFCRRWGINELALFGSAARGEMTAESDLDVMVQFEPDAKIGVWDLVRLQRELSQLAKRRIDVVERGTIRNPFRKASIERDLTVVYTA